MADARMLDMVEVSTLHHRLGFQTPLDYPAESRRRPLADWKMEIDDAPILRYLYRNFKPRRHLEFGTWLGTGACYCLEESHATVWTINVHDGELVDDQPAYASTLDTPPAGAQPICFGGQGAIYQTDAGTLIGYRYRDAGFGPRVCQIYSDSRDWDTSVYPRDFFDSVMIDGGRAERRAQ